MAPGSFAPSSLLRRSTRPRCRSRSPTRRSARSNPRAETEGADSRGGHRSRAAGRKPASNAARAESDVSAAARSGPRAHPRPRLRLRARDAGLLEGVEPGVADWVDSGVAIVRQAGDTRLRLGPRNVPTRGGPERSLQQVRHAN